MEKWDLAKVFQDLARVLPRHEAEWIVCEAFYQVVGKDLTRVEIWTYDQILPEELFKKCEAWKQGRVAGVPLQHLLGRMQFRDHFYRVGPEALIPRPETEGLIVLAVHELQKRFGGGLLRGFEIGAGSGVISIELLSHFAHLSMIATELTPAAAALARQNAASILGDGAERLKVDLASGALDVLSSVRAANTAQVPFDFVISNPPYLLPEDEIEEEVRKHEPSSALFVGEGGGALHFYQEIASLSGASGSDLLVPGGFVFLELPHERAPEIQKIFCEAGWQEVKLHDDLSGRPRVLSAKRP